MTDLGTFIAYQDKKILDLIEKCKKKEVSDINNYNKLKDLCTLFSNNKTLDSALQKQKIELEKRLINENSKQQALNNLLNHIKKYNNIDDINSASNELEKVKTIINKLENL